ncbi:MAG TPA: hypothetical protein G4O12_08190 [Dehalococcoidia bacterium]|nr:hypothetical protein [Dehalococcoidia bacterium]
MTEGIIPQTQKGTSIELTPYTLLVSFAYSVIPSGGGPTGKAPLIAWEQYQHVTPEIEDLQAWEQELKPSMWGIVTGAISYVVIIDIDKPELRTMFDKSGLLPHIQTPRGGFHYWFRHPGHSVKTMAGLLPGIDVRGDGGFVNVIGKRKDGEYKVLIPPSPDAIYPWEKLPGQITHALDGQRSQAPPIEGETIPEHKRNTTLIRLAGSLRRQGLSQEAIEAALQGINNKSCKPPLEEREVASIARSAAKYPAGINNTDTSIRDYILSANLASDFTKNSQKIHKMPFGIEDIREFVRSQGFKYWEVRTLDYELGIIATEHKRYRWRLLSLLQEKEEIEQHPTDGKKYRQISPNDTIDYKSVTLTKPLDLWLPFDIHRHFNTYPGNLLDFAGVTDSGKTALAVNIIRNNDDKWDIEYWTNEVSAEELNERLQNIEPGKYIEDWNFKAKPIQPGYLQKIRPDILSIFDYIDVGDPFYRISEEQQAIHDAIGKGVAIIFLQKDEARVLARGKGFSAQLPRLYVSMGMKSAYCYKAKTPKNPSNPLKGKTCNFTLTNGIHFTFSEWRYESESDAK